MYSGFSYKSYAAQVVREIESADDPKMLIKFINEMVKCAKASNKNLEIPKIIINENYKKN